MSGGSKALGLGLVTVLKIVTVWVQLLPQSHSSGSSSHWRQKMPAGKPERSGQPMESCPGKRSPEESVLHIYLKDTVIYWLLQILHWLRLTDCFFKYRWNVKTYLNMSMDWLFRRDECMFKCFNVLLDCTLENVTFANFNKANNNDKSQCHQLPHSEDILDPGAHPDTAAVYPCQQHWAENTHIDNTTHHYFVSIEKCTASFKVFLRCDSDITFAILFWSMAFTFCWNCPRNEPHTLNFFQGNQKLQRDEIYKWKSKCDSHDESLNEHCLASFKHNT